MPKGQRDCTPKPDRRFALVPGFLSVILSGAKNLCSTAPLDKPGRKLRGFFARQKSGGLRMTGTESVT
jgi:hypothetical protein